MYYLILPLTNIPAPRTKLTSCAPGSVREGREGSFRALSQDLVFKLSSLYHSYISSSFQRIALAQKIPSKQFCVEVYMLFNYTSSSLMSKKFTILSRAPIQLSRRGVQSCLPPHPWGSWFTQLQPIAL